MIWFIDRIVVGVSEFFLLLFLKRSCRGRWGVVEKFEFGLFVIIVCKDVELFSDRSFSFFSKMFLFLGDL